MSRGQATINVGTTGELSPVGGDGAKLSPRAGAAEDSHPPVVRGSNPHVASVSATCPRIHRLYDDDESKISING